MAAPPQFRFKSTPQYSPLHGPGQSSNTLGGDFNGDGLPDLLTNGQVALNRGFGSFTQSAGGIGVASIENAIGDFDNDGDLDIAASAHGIAAAVLVYPNLGNGTFGAPTSHPCIDPRHIVSGDFDQDGKADIAVYDYDFVGNGGRIQVLLNANGLVASPPQSAPLGDAVMDVGDCDGDGRTDLVFSFYQFTFGIWTMRGLGGGAFAPAQSVSLVTAHSLAVTDLDKDGRADLVVNENNGASSVTTVLFSTGSGFATNQAFGYINFHSDPTRSVIADFNFDKNLDLLTLLPSQPSILRFGNSAGVFGGPKNVDLGGMATAVAMLLDGDGFTDLVVESAFGAVYGLMGQGDGTFVKPPATGSTSNVTSVPLLRDADGDSKADLLVIDGSSIRFQKGVGNGSFGAAISSAAASRPWLVPANSNNDGKLDLLVAGNDTLSGPGTISVHLGAGNGSFAAAQTITTLSALTIPPVPGDVDNDGDDDLFLLTQSGVFLCIAAPGPNPYGAPVSIAASTGYGSLAAADFDLDGVLDFVVSTNVFTQTNNVKCLPFLGNGSGTFTPGPVSVVTSATLNPDRQFSVARDFDHDGDMDLCLLSSTKIFQLSYGAGGFSVVTQNSGIGVFITQPVDVNFGDLDTDGFTDVVIGGTIIPGTASGFDPAASNVLVNFGSDTNPSSNGLLNGSDLADLNGDGRIDAVVGRPLNSQKDFAILIQDKCVSAAEAYGSGCPGSGGFSPILTFNGCPDPGETVKLGAKFGLGGATMVVLLGTSPANLPLGGGCRLLLFPVLPQSLAIPLAGGGAGNGSFLLPSVYPASAVGLNLAMQGFVVDPGATLGYAATNGIQLLH